jgi:hypothetical protein
MKMRRILSFASVLVLLFVLTPPSSFAAKMLPGSFELGAFLQKNFGAAAVEFLSSQAIGADHAFVFGVSVALVEDLMDGMNGPEILESSFDYRGCDWDSLVLSNPVRQPLDGVTILRRSLSCIADEKKVYVETLIVEDGSRFHSFHIYDGEERLIKGIGDTILAALIEIHR